MNCNRIVGAVLILLLLQTNATAQDLHFSQFMNSPLTTNPANTGFIPEADYRIGGNFRSQWTSVPVPYKTASIWGDVQVFRNSIENGWVGVGGLLLTDVAGRGNLRSNKVYGSVAYHQMIGLSSLLSAGFNAGYASKRIDITKFTFDNQWNGKFFDAGAPNGEALLTNANTAYFDLQVGMNYAYFPTENTYINAGVSVHHINKPKETFFSNGTNEVPRRYIGFLNGSFKVNDDWIVNPNAYFSSQAGANETVFGGNLAYNVMGDGSVVVFGGAYYRWADAAVAMVGLEWKDIRFTFTYDATTSNLGRFNSANGAYEFSLIKNGYYNEYFGDKSQRRQSLCPRF
ncbi:PorP/SprF family type IX secretion system membrane protein [Lacibacter sediminis]|uniref:PorP/SprF family type IX secretion system membrane protein n=1 Tax=Lacibacter sediminis TaxID=2760713 RepID=A0A7G5XIJ2_9BACT|nr:PorP/SprF family type IX secretion system membrane protein [Lacibacter sediminis]QNA45295.1 PorP/SprF family type IX secretion system membrane protein [Lacibacter sediminis]